MDHLNIILPGTLLLIGFLLKVFIGRNIEIPSLIQSLCELPVDIMFLALSFAIAFTISNSVNQAVGLFYCFAGIAVAIVIVVLWRISLRSYLRNNKKYWWVLILALNLFMSGLSIKKSIDLIIADEIENQDDLTSIYNHLKANQ